MVYFKWCLNFVSFEYNLFYMFHFSLVSLFTCVTFPMLNFSHASLFYMFHFSTCFTFLQFSLVSLIACFTFHLFHFSTCFTCFTFLHVSLFPCFTFRLLHFSHVSLFPCLTFYLFQTETEDSTVSTMNIRIADYATDDFSSFKK